MQNNYSKMDPKLKRQWLKALRSGKYRGCKGRLCQVADNGAKSYCCLGVLNEIAGLGRSPYSGNLPAYVVDDTAQNHLIAMNDDQRAGFKKIADWIEKNL